MVITKDDTYKNDTLYNEFIEKSKKHKNFVCEVNFESFHSNTNIYDTVRVWYKDDLYGTSYTIRNGEVSIRKMDKICESVAVKISDIKNMADFLINEIIRGV